jgi:hypothetical protein
LGIFDANREFLLVLKNWKCDKSEIFIAEVHGPETQPTGRRDTQIKQTFTNRMNFIDASN